MKRISYYIASFVLVSGVIVGAWVWQKYVAETPPRLLEFAVTRGVLRDVVNARGDVVAAKEINLEFPFSAIVRRVIAAEGAVVEAGAPLVSLDVNDLVIDLRRLEAVLAQQQANLEKLSAGPTAEDLAVSEIKVANAGIALRDAEQNLVDKLRDAYTKADDAIHNETDQFFDNPRSSDPQLNIAAGDFAREARIESARFSLETVLSRWALTLAALTPASVSGMVADDAQTRLAAAAAFLEDLAFVVNRLVPTASLSRTIIDGYRAAVGTARANVNAAIVNVTAAHEKLRSAASAGRLAAQELAFKKTGTRAEDLAIARAQIAEAEGNIAATGEKIRKATLYATERAKVLKIYVEEGELFAPGKTAVSIASTAHEVQADISELDIGRVAVGTPAEFTLDAFPGEAFLGAVSRIDEQPVVKDGDTYYRVHITMRDEGSRARIGMKADVAIVVAEKTDALYIPKFAVVQKDGAAAVRVAAGGAWRDVPVVTGISDGESVEIVEGLEEGQTVVIQGE